VPPPIDSAKRRINKITFSSQYLLYAHASKYIHTHRSDCNARWRPWHHRRRLIVYRRAKTLNVGKRGLHLLLRGLVPLPLSFDHPLPLLVAPQLLLLPQLSLLLQPRLDLLSLPPLFIWAYKISPQCYNAKQRCVKSKDWRMERN